MSYVMYVSNDDQNPSPRKRAVNGLKSRLQRLKRIPVELHQAARFSSLLRLGTARLIKYQVAREDLDLYGSIDPLRSAARTWLGTRRRRAAAANNLAVALIDHSRRMAYSGHASDADLRRAVRDLDEAIRALDFAVHPRRGGPAEVRRLTNLITALEDLTRLTSRHAAAASVRRTVDQLPDVNVVRQRLGSMASAPDFVRVDALRTRGYALAEAEGPAAGHGDLAAAIALLPRTAGWARADSEHARVLSGSPGLAADATACAVAAGDPTRAILLFETGRALQWDHLLHRSIRAELQAVRPRLARKLDRCVARLDRRGGVPDDPRLAVVDRWAIVERLAEARLRGSYPLNQRRWNRLARRAQSAVPDATLREQQYASDIRPAADEGPVVAVVASRFGCYALIVRSDRREPQVVELSDLSHDSAHDWARRYLAALNEATGREREQEILATLQWLWRAITSPVLDALGQSGRSDDPPRLWWCPSGALAALPLHAACAAEALEEGAERSDSVLDRVVSSYTPTVRSLISTRKARDLRQKAVDQDERRLLLVSVDGGPDGVSLAGAARFREQLADLVPTDRLTRLEGPSATCESVARAMHRHACAHFDCHGVQDLVEPFGSGLALHDRTLTVEELATVRKYRPEFAFLAACTTALADGRMPDEVVSLTSALHYSGYQHVIGTLSPVLDSSTGRLSRSLYDQLTTGGQVSPANSAGSLRRAVLIEQAEHPRNPSMWVPYVHIGV